MYHGRSPFNLGESGGLLHGEVSGELSGDLTAAALRMHNGVTFTTLGGPMLALG